MDHMWCSPSRETGEEVLERESAWLGTVMSGVEEIRLETGEDYPVRSSERQPE